MNFGIPFDCIYHLYKPLCPSFLKLVIFLSVVYGPSVSLCNFLMIQRKPTQFQTSPLKAQASIPLFYNGLRVSELFYNFLHPSSYSFMSYSISRNHKFRPPLSKKETFLFLDLERSNFVTFSTQIMYIFHVD